MPKTYIGDDAAFVMSFKENLRDVMETKKIKKAFIAKWLGISHAMLNEYIRGGYIPTDEVLSKLAKILDCSVEDLTRVRPEFKDL